MLPKNNWHAKIEYFPHRPVITSFFIQCCTATLSNYSLVCTVSLAFLLFVNTFSKETAIRSSPPLWPSGEMQFCLRDLNSLRTVTSPSTQARHSPYTVHSDKVLKWGGKREDLRVGPRRGRLYPPIRLSRRERPPHGASHPHFRVQGCFCPPRHCRHSMLPLRPHGQKRQEPGTHYRQARRQHARRSRLRPRHHHGSARQSDPRLLRLSRRQSILRAPHALLYQATYPGLAGRDHR